MTRSMTTCLRGRSALMTSWIIQGCSSSTRLSAVSTRRLRIRHRLLTRKSGLLVRSRTIYEASAQDPNVRQPKPRKWSLSPRLANLLRLVQPKYLGRGHLLKVASLQTSSRSTTSCTSTMRSATKRPSWTVKNRRTERRR